MQSIVRGPVGRLSGGRGARPRGVSMLLVLALLSMTLALAYAMTRLNFSLEQTQTNTQRSGDSRQAAYTGLSAALSKLKQANWAGVDSTVTGSLGNGLSYSATFTTGDPSLTPASPDYSQFPYRLTVVSTGTAVDPSNPSISSTNRVQAVVRFIPRKLVDPPNTWNNLQNYTLYQWGTSSETLRLGIPLRIEGPVLSQNAVSLAGSEPSDGDVLPFAGQIDEVSVFNKALNSQQIETIYQDGGGGVFTGEGHRLVARWKFDEAAGAVVAQDQKDSYDGLYDGGRSGGTPAPMGGTGSAVFDGVNDHVHLGTIDAPGDEITILAWIKPTSFPSDNGRIIAKASGPDTDDQYWTLSHSLTNGNRAIRFRLKTNSGGTSTLTSSGVNLVAGQWAFIAAVYTGSKMQIYKNGVLAGEMSKWGDLPAAPTVLASVGNSPPASPRARYLRDVQKMYVQNGTDYRPLTIPITAPLSRTSSAERSLFTDELQTTWTDLPATTAAPLTHPGSVLTYRLYPGGKSYAIPTLGGTLRNQVLGPDQEINPLGVFYRLGNLNVAENVSITGVVIVNASDSTPDIEVYGDNVSFNSVTLPAVDGSTDTPKLPVAIVKDDFRFYSGASGQLNGVAVAWGELGFTWGSQATQWNWTGHAIANTFYSDPRFEWSQTSDWWKARLRSFLLQLSSANPVLYFPEWLHSNYGLDPLARIVLRPPSATDTFHWHNWAQPIFVAHPNDGGLRWELLEVRELH